MTSHRCMLKGELALQPRQKWVMPPGTDSKQFNVENHNIELPNQHGSTTFFCSTPASVCKQTTVESLCRRGCRAWWLRYFATNECDNDGSAIPVHSCKRSASIPPHAELYCSAFQHCYSQFVQAQYTIPSTSTEPLKSGRGTMARTPVRTFLRGCLRALNYLLAIVGVLMVAYALFMYVEFTDAHPSVPPANDLMTLRSLSVAGRHKIVKLSSAMQLEHDLGRGNGNHVNEFLGRRSPNKLAKCVPSITMISLVRVDRQTWLWYGACCFQGVDFFRFIYLLGGAGAFIFVTASVGILSADCAACGVTCFLGMYHALMVLLLLLQICLVCFYFFNKSWEEDLPPDSTGEYAKLRDLVVHHLYACKVIGLSTLGLQLLALMVSCSLYYAENKPRYEYRTVPVEPQDYESASQISVQARSAEAMTQ